jgi:D-beta-D-heptose 7-phosphate kinase/D-beta-D-heptose 1-phosphate adenosyltransferase
MLNKNILIKKCDNYRRSSSSIVFSNGCFDLLHKGHIDLLSTASKLGEILIVGLNSDSSIKRIKGPKRPIQNQEVRKKKLLKLKFVNDVFIFDEDTPLNLICMLKPKFLVKGGDYKSEEIVGYNEMQNWGGEVKIVELTPGFSTTISINKKKL